MQQCYNPVAVCDLDFDQANKHSNKNGDWPTRKPPLLVGTTVVRHLAVFNDEFAGENVSVTWEVHAGTAAGPLVKSGKFALTIPLGEFATQDITFQTPATPGDLCLILMSSKAGLPRFRDDLLLFQVTSSLVVLVPDGDYKLVNGRSGLAVGLATDVGGTALAQAPLADAPVWHLANLGGDDVTLTRVDNGLRLDVGGSAAENQAPATPDGGG